MVSGDDDGRDSVRVEADGDILRHPREPRRGTDPIMKSYNRSYIGELQVWAQEEETRTKLDGWLRGLTKGGY